MREYAAAKKSYEEALAINRKVLPEGHPDIALNLGNLGLVQHDLGKYAAAKQSQEEALSIRRKALPPNHPEIAMSLNNLGIVQKDLREYAAARKSHEEALAIRRQALPPDHPDIADSLNNLGLIDCISGTDPRDAIPRLVAATDFYQANQFRLTVAQAEQQQIATAIRSKICLGLLLSAVLAAAADPGPAYDRVLGVKGAVTTQQHWLRQARDSDPDSARLLDRLGRVTRQISALAVADRSGERLGGPQTTATLIRDLSAERAQLERQLSERSAAFRAAQARVRAGAGEVRAALARDTALLDFVEYLHVAAPADGQERPSAEMRVVTFVIRPEQKGVAIVPLGPSRTLIELIERWRATFGAGKTPPDGMADPAAELVQRMWRPLAEHLAGVKVVLVSPDGPLNGLPLAALRNSREGTFLIHDYAFATVPVPQLLPEMLRDRPGRAASPASLAVGDIDFDALPGAAGATERDNHFPRLPGTQAEVAAVHELFRAAFADRPAALLTGKAATKEVFVSRAPQCSHLLVATHGFFLPDPEQKEFPGSGGLRSLETLLFRRGLCSFSIFLPTV